MPSRTAQRKSRAPQSRTRLSRPARSLQRVSWFSLLATAAVCVPTGWGQVPLWWIPLLTLVVAMSAATTDVRRAGRQRRTFSLTACAVAAALALAPGSWAVLAVGLGVVGGAAMRHQPRRKRIFDLAQIGLATALAQALAAALGGGIAAACAGMALFWLVRDLLAAVAVSLTSRRPFRSLLRSGRLTSALHTAGSCAVGLLVAHLVLEAPWGLLGLAVPLALLWSSYDQQTHSGAQARLFAELARSSDSAKARSADVTAQVVLTAAARLLGGADIELVLLAADGPVRYVGNETGTPSRHRVGSGVFDEPWVLRALGEGGVAAGREGARPYVCAVVGTPDTPLAVLRARRGPGSTGFDRNELHLTKVLVEQAGAWLSAADPAAPAAVPPEEAGNPTRPDLGTAAALLVLCESADRLAHLARSGGGLDQIVEELHLLERAVVSLLGAGALAAEPEAAQAPAPALSVAAAPTPRASTEWTTTGVLP